MYLDRQDDAAENSIMQTISIAVSAILIAAGLITAPSLINNARDTNATGDLANLANAQEYALANTGEYANGLQALRSATSKSEDLDGGLKFTLASDGPGLGNSAQACQGSDGQWHYVDGAKSGSGRTFYRTDATTKVSDDPASLEGDSCLNLGTIAPSNPGGDNGDGGSIPGDGDGGNTDDPGDGGDTPVSLTGVCESGYTFTATDSWRITAGTNSPNSYWDAQNRDADDRYIHSDDKPSSVLLQRYLSWASASDGSPSTCRVQYLDADQVAIRSGDRPAFLQYDTAYSDWMGDYHSVAKIGWNDRTADQGAGQGSNIMQQGHRADSSKPFSIKFDGETGQPLQVQYNAVRVEDGFDVVNVVNCDGTGFASCKSENQSQDDVFTQARYNAIGTLSDYPELVALTGK